MICTEIGSSTENIILLVHRQSMVPGIESSASNGLSDKTTLSFLMSTLEALSCFLVAILTRDCTDALAVCR